MFFLNPKKIIKVLPYSPGLASPIPQVNRFSQYYGGRPGLYRIDPGKGFGCSGISGWLQQSLVDNFERGQQRQGQNVDKGEVGLEFTYAINLSPYFVIQPDLQYIINPDTNPAVPNALVMGARIQLNLSWFESLSDYEEPQQ